jgi:hypothetical protein
LRQRPRYTAGWQSPPPALLSCSPWFRSRAQWCQEKEQPPDEPKERAAAQAEAAGVSLNQYIATAVAARVGAQAEAERYFAARAARAQPGRAREILGRAGRAGAPAEGDEAPG